MLQAAFARPVGDAVRAAAERWVEQGGAKGLANWLRYVEGPRVVPQTHAVRSIKAHAKGASGLELAADGTVWTWVGRGANELLRWDLEAGKRVAKIRPPFEPSGCDTDSDGWVAVGGFDESAVAIWDPSGKRVHRFDSGRDRAFVRWVPSSQGRAVLVADGGVHVTELSKRGSVRWSFERADRNAGPPIYDTAICPGGLEALALEIDDGGAARARFLRLADGTLTRTVELASEFPKSDPVGVIALSPSGRLLAYGSLLFPGGVRVFDLASGQVLHRFAPALSAVATLTFATDDELWCGAEGLVLRFTLSTNEVRALRAADTGVVGLRLVGKHVAVALSDGRLLSFLRDDCAFDPDSLHAPAPVSAIAGGGRQPRILAFGSDVLWELRPGLATASAPLPYLGDMLALDARGEYLAAARNLPWKSWEKAPPEVELSVLELGSPPLEKSKLRLRQTKLEGFAQHARITPEAALFATTGQYTTTEPLVTLSLDGFALERHAAWGDATVQDLCVCPSGELACALQNGSLLLFDKTWSNRHVLYRSASAMLCVVSFDEQLLALDAAGVVRAFDLKSRAPRFELSAEPNPSFQTLSSTLVVSAEGDRALAASGTGPALMFKVSDGTVVAKLGTRRSVQASFSSDGLHVSTLDDQAALNVWSTKAGSLVASYRFDAPPQQSVWLGSSEIVVWEKSFHFSRFKLESGAKHSPAS